MARQRPRLGNAICFCSFSRCAARQSQVLISPGDKLLCCRGRCETNSGNAEPTASWELQSHQTRDQTLSLEDGSRAGALITKTHTHKQFVYILKRPSCSCLVFVFVFFFFVSLFFVAFALQPCGLSQTVLMCNFNRDDDFFFFLRAAPHYAAWACRHPPRTSDTCVWSLRGL